GQTTYCAGNTAAISAPSGFSSYNWSTGANTQNTNVTDADNPITVTVIDANGCPGTSPAFTVSEESQINYSETIEICQGQSTTIHGNTETTAGLYEETFTTGGCDSTASITLVVNSLPSITASATDTDVCINDDTDLSGSGGSSYDWDNGLGAGANHNVSPGSTTTYTVTGTDANGCENTDDVTITVNPLPTVDAGTDISECENETIILSGSGSATSYSWDNGVSDGVGFTQPVGTVTYTVTGTDANGCENTDQVDVTIESAPNVYAGTDVTVCENETITLSGSGTATNYTWDNGVTDGVGFTQSPGTVTYTVTGESSAGCAATDEVDVTVNPSPTIDAGSNQELCDGDNVTLTGSGNADTYTWDNGVTDGVDFTPPLGTTTYTVTGENTATGCTATDDVDITVNELPTVDAGADQSICEGEEIILSGSGDATNYTWDNGITDGVGFTPSVGTTVYTVTGEDANGCQNTATVSITTTTNPIADFSADPTEGEAPLEVELTNNSSNGSTFEWDFGNGQFENTNSPTDQNTVYTEPGVFEIWLTVTNDEGCTDQMSLTIVIDDLPLSYTIPNIFTPNKDGSNDFLNMNVNNAESIYMEIFNRWGNLVGIVDSIDPEKGWDGTDHKTGQPASEGVYFYTYKIVDLDGEEVNGHNYVHLKR
ncbi:MAG: gliding motility-associated C-terminal domain-containing protein, partial [Brumimicrobium sp.]